MSIQHLSVVLLTSHQCPMTPVPGPTYHWEGQDVNMFFYQCLFLISECLLLYVPCKYICCLTSVCSSSGHVSGCVILCVCVHASSRGIKVCVCMAAAV